MDVVPGGCNQERRRQSLVEYYELLRTRRSKKKKGEALGVEVCMCMYDAHRRGGLGMVEDLRRMHQSRMFQGDGA